MSAEACITVSLANKKGLHARAAAKFVKVAGQFNAKIMVEKVAGVGVVEGAAPAQTSGGSILGLMMLGAEYGSTLRLTATGEQAQDCVMGLKKLVEERFGEE